jgi:hypothetical protein
MAVRMWTSYNAAFEIAARCQLLLSKVCSFHVTNSSNFEVTLHSTHYAAFSPCLITIGFSKKEDYRDKIHVVFDEKLRLDEMEPYQLDGFAYDIGKNIAEKYTILDATPKHFVYFLEKDYDEFEHEYEIGYDGKTETFKTDYPLNKYMATEFEVESILSVDKNIKSPFESLKRNGYDLFSEKKLSNRPFTSYITITKNKGKLSVVVDIRGMLYDDWLAKTNLVSKVHSLGEFGFLKSFEYTKGKEQCLIIISGNNDRKVRIERVRNYGLSPNDIVAAIPLIEEKIGFLASRDWSNYFDY